MELYNSLIQETRNLLPAPTRVWNYSPDDCWTDTGISELVLQKDAAYELGASGKGSANLVLYTSSPVLSGENKIVLYGKDLDEISGDSDFARIVILRIGVLDVEDEVAYRTLKDIEFSKYHVFPQGYMVRMSPESFREQIRVSREALRRHISFRNIGSSYLAQYKKNLNVLSGEIIFVTDPGVNYEALKNIAKKGSEITSTLTHILEGLPTDCSICSLKDVCDEIEGMKELHFGIKTGI